MISPSRLVPQASLSLNCLVLGLGLDRSFTVEIGIMKTVDHLKDDIKSRTAPLFNGIPTVNLELHRTSLPNDSRFESKLKGLNFRESVLKPTMMLARAFPDSPAENHVHIIVQPPSSGELSALSAPSDHRYCKNLVAKLVPGPIQDRTAYLTTELEAPSSQNFHKIQQHHRYLCHRPLDAEDPVPVTLLEPVFAQFVEDCQTHQPSDEDNDFVGMLSHQMSIIYDDELDRMAKFRKQLPSYGIELVTANGGSTRFARDSNLSVNKYAVVIAEGDSEVGTGGGDLFAQALVYYHRSLQQLDPDKSKIARLRTVFPCFHIIVFGGFSSFVYSSACH